MDPTCVQLLIIWSSRSIQRRPSVCSQPLRPYKNSYYRRDSCFLVFCRPTIVRRNRFLQRKRFRLFVHILPPSVCLSSVCHIRAPCLNCWTDLDAIWQLHLWHSVRSPSNWSRPTPRGMGRSGVKPPAKTCSCFRLTKKVIYDSPGATSINNYSFYLALLAAPA